MDKATLRLGLGVDVSWLPKGAEVLEEEQEAPSFAGEGGMITRVCASSVSCFSTQSVILLTADSRGDMSTAAPEIWVKVVATDELTPWQNREEALVL